MTMSDAERAIFEKFHAYHARGEAAAAEYVDTHEKVGGLVTGLVACTDAVVTRDMLMQVYVDGYAQGRKDEMRSMATS